MEQTRITMVQPIDPAAYASTGRLVQPIGARWDEVIIAAHTYETVSQEVRDWGRFNRLVRFHLTADPDSWGYALALEENAGNIRCPQCGSWQYHPWPAHEFDSWKQPYARHVTGRACASCGTAYQRTEHPSYREVMAAADAGATDPPLTALPALMSERTAEPAS